MRNKLLCIVQIGRYNNLSGCDIQNHEIYSLLAVSHRVIVETWHDEQIFNVRTETEVWSAH